MAPPQRNELQVQKLLGLADQMDGNLKAVLTYHKNEKGRWPIPKGLTKDDFKEASLRELEFDHLRALFGDVGAINVHVELHGSLPPEVAREWRKYADLAGLSAEALSALSYVD